MLENCTTAFLLQSNDEALLKVATDNNWNIVTRDTILDAVQKHFQ